MVLNESQISKVQTFLPPKGAIVHVPLLFLFVRPSCLSVCLMSVAQDELKISKFRIRPKAPLKGYLQSMSIRIINNFKLMVLRAQTELGALLWICFTPKYMLLIFGRKKNLLFFFAEFFSDFFSPKIFFQQKKSIFFSPTKIFGRKKICFFFSKKNQKYSV